MEMEKGGDGPLHLLYFMESNVFGVLPCQAVYLSPGWWLSSTCRVCSRAVVVSCCDRWHHSVPLYLDNRLRAQIARR